MAKKRKLILVAVLAAAPLIAFIAVFLYFFTIALISIPSHSISAATASGPIETEPPDSSTDRANKSDQADRRLALASNLNQDGIGAKNLSNSLREKLDLFQTPQLTGSAAEKAKKVNLQFELLQQGTKNIIEQSDVAPANEIYDSATTQILSYYKLELEAYNGSDHLNSGPLAAASEEPLQELRRSIRRSYAREGRWIDLASTYSDKFWATKSYYLRKAGLPGELEIARIAARKSWAAILNIRLSKDQRANQIMKIGESSAYPGILSDYED